MFISQHALSCVIGYKACSCYTDGLYENVSMTKQTGNIFLREDLVISITFVSGNTWLFAWDTWQPLFSVGIGSLSNLFEKKKR